MPASANCSGPNHRERSVVVLQPAVRSEQAPHPARMHLRAGRALVSTGSACGVLAVAGGCMGAALISVVRPPKRQNAKPTIWRRRRSGHLPSTAPPAARSPCGSTGPAQPVGAPVAAAPTLTDDGGASEPALRDCGLKVRRQVHHRAVVLANEVWHGRDGPSGLLLHSL